MKEKFSKHIEFIKSYWEILFFLAGFFFDIFTLGEAEDSFNILQQVFYITFSILFLTYELRKQLDEGYKPHPFLLKNAPYLNLAFHFFIGSLLSAFLIFFFKSSSIISSGFFIISITTAFIINEFTVSDRWNLIIKSVLLFICINSFFSYIFVFPLGFIGFIPFLLGLIINLFITWALFTYLKSKEISLDQLNNNFFFPAITTTILFVSFYMLNILPPVPIAIKQARVCREVSKNNENYLCYHSKLWWNFWDKGEQVFRYEKGDKVYVFFSIFSPLKFSDSVSINWYYKQNGQWVKTDGIQVQLTGGRRHGFRAYVYKKNLQTGNWYTTVTTKDSREVGRIYFKVRPKEPNEIITLKTEMF